MFDLVDRDGAPHTRARLADAVAQFRTSRCAWAIYVRPKAGIYSLHDGAAVQQTSRVDRYAVDYKRSIFLYNFPPWAEEDRGERNKE